MSEELIGGTELYDKEFRAAQKRLRQRSEEAAAMVDGAADHLPQARVVIVDDQDLVRNGFRLILSSYASIKVVGEAVDGREALDVVRETKPDVVLMDIRMPLMNGIEATKAIAADVDLPDVHVLVLTTFDVDEYVYDALAAGASGFMLKDSEPDDIAHAVHVVAQGDALIQPSVMRRLVEMFVSTRSAKPSVDASLDALTEREREILVMVAHGLNNDSIAADLVISPATVKTHVARIMAKLDAHDRAQLVVLAYENGLVSVGS